ncbi:MAG: ATP-dependent helicase C-terminal domain-containing protein, partial [Hyphomicrobium sp.]
EWGVTDAASLSWLDAPPPAALAAAREELTDIGALDAQGRITETGQRIRALPLPPRLARMVISAAAIGAERPAADIAAVLVERGLGGMDTDLDHRIDNFRRDRSRRADDMRRLAEGWSRAARTSQPPGVSPSGSDTHERSRRRAAAGSAGGATVSDPSSLTPGTTIASLLALAYPDRIAKARGAPGQFLLANGCGARVDASDALAGSPFLVVAEMQGSAAATRILLAARATEGDVLAMASHRIRDTDEVTFDRDAAALRSRRIRRLDAIVLHAEPRAVEPGDATAAALAEGIASLGILRLPWSRAQIQLRDRVAFLRAASGDDWPDLSDAALAASAGAWLAPFLSGKTRLSDIGADDLGQALDALVPWNLKRKLEEEAPTHFEAPTGNRHAIDYEGAGAPALFIRVQELFGLKQHPSIAGGRLPLTLNLLSPAHRPIQITRDLPGFWAGSWSAVKSEMKGRYPRHVWPDDPANALPTTRAKPRGT